MIRFSELEQITGGKVLQAGKDREIRILLYDSRKPVSSEEAVFFAIKGRSHDGHRFIDTLYQKGVRQFVVEDESVSLPQDANVLLCHSSVDALQKLSLYHRSRYNYPVIGITGSNGKTIVKEWLSELFYPEKKIIKSPKSYNSQIGVPLSVWQMNGSHELGIFEAGISLPGEMVKLQPVIRPSAGIFTNIGPAHDKGFGSRREKVTEKLKLFSETELLVYCRDYQMIDEEVKIALPQARKIAWSASEEGDYYAVKVNESELKVCYEGNVHLFPLKYNDLASVENLSHCIFLLLSFGFSAEHIKTKLQSLHPVKMRLEVKDGRNHCLLIDDSYNNDLAGITIALNFLEQQHQRERRTVILSDVPEESRPPQEIYPEIALLVRNKNIDRFIGIGREIEKYRDHFPGGEFYTSGDKFLSQLDPDSFQNELVLVKGARAFGLEKVVHVLEQKVHGTVMEVNLDALSHNLNFYRRSLKPETRLMVMVKAFAYGSGSFEVANLLEFHRVDYLAVAYADEGVELRQNGVKTPVMVMNPMPEAFDALVEYDLEPEIYSFSLLEKYILFLQSSQRTSDIHLKLDTGMHRLGFSEEEIPQLGRMLRDADEINITSIFSHLAAADEEQEDEFTKSQAEQFNRMADELEKYLDEMPLRHILNSAGIIRFPQHQMDMVRLGIGIYGVDSSGKHQKELMPVATLKTVISQVRKVPAGDTIGYGRKGKASQDIEIATIAIGYADGYDRKFSNGTGKVMVRGKICPVIGNVCMDMTMVDITGTGAKEGDEVIIFGKEPSIIELAEDISTIPYEILTNVSGRVKRIFYTE